MKLTKVIFSIAVIIVAAWIIGFIFKLAAWIISSLLYIAAIVVIIGLVSAYIESKKSHTSPSDRK